MRLRDLVKGGGATPSSPRGPAGPSRRLSDVVRKAGEPARPAPESVPPEPALPETPPETPPTEEVAAEVVPATPREEPEARPPTPSPRQEQEAADQVLHRAERIVEEILQAVRAQAPIPLASAGGAVEILLQNLEAGDTLLVPFFSAGSGAPSLAREAVNVGILSLKIAMELGYSPEELRKLGLAALLCDVGVTRVSPQILGKRGGLTPDERAQLEASQREGAKLFQRLGPEASWLAELVEKRFEKTEAPSPPESKIAEFAAVIRLADIYESLVHNRPFRQRVGPLEAVKEILQRERKSFPDRILKALLRVLTYFPVGSMVRLNTGELGRVVKKNKDLPLRPVVEILVRRGKRLESPVVMDLSRSPLHHIQDAVVEEEEVP